MIDLCLSIVIFISCILQLLIKNWDKAKKQYSQTFLRLSCFYNQVFNYDINQSQYLIRIIKFYKCLVTQYYDEYNCDLRRVLFLLFPLPVTSMHFIIDSILFFIIYTWKFISLVIPKISNQISLVYWNFLYSYPTYITLKFKLMINLFVI